MTVAYLGLGANLGDARQTLQDAVVCLAQQCAVMVIGKSSLYRTAPLDANGADYYNCAVKIDTQLTARSLLALCHTIEHHFGRERPFRNAPRTLDIDLLLYGDMAIDEPGLIVPHPRLTARAFALVPLVELAPLLSIPRHGRADIFLAGLRGQRIEKVQAACECPLPKMLANTVKGRCP